MDASLDGAGFAEPHKACGVGSSASRVDGETFEGGEFLSWSGCSCPQTFPAVDLHSRADEQSEGFLIQRTNHLVIQGVALRNRVMWEPSAHKPDELRATIHTADDSLLSKRIPYKVLLMSKHSTFQTGFIVRKKKKRKEEEEDDRKEDNNLHSLFQEQRL